MKSVVEFFRDPLDCLGGDDQPPNSWIVRGSTPAIASLEANVCRRVGGVTPVSFASSHAASKAFRIVV